MTAILRGLNSGYAPEQILQYLMKSIPQMAPTIRRAAKAGYPAQQILGFLSKSFETEDRKGMSESQIHAANRRSDAERTKFGLKAAATAVVAPLAASAVGGALSRALPTNLRNMFAGNIAGSAAQPSPGQAAPLGNPAANPNMPPLAGIPSPPTQGATPLSGQSQISSSQPPLAPSIPQTPNIQQPQTSFDSASILDKLGIKNKIERLRHQGKDPEIIRAAISKLITPEMEKKAGMPLKDVVEDYLSKGPTTRLAKLPEGQGRNFKGLLEPFEDKPLNPEDYQVKPLEKQQTVASPQGMGEVREIRGDKALIDINGKLHKVDVDELIQSPVPEKDLADLYDELNEGIEKETGEDISRMVNYAGYDPKTNKMVFLPHNGALYEYSDIEPEEVEMLTDILNVRKSSGENFIGAWKAGSKSPIGAAMSALIKKLQEKAGGKGKEYSGKYETVYSYLEPAVRAAKKKKKKK
jgi:hypothetical protein